MGKWCGLVGCLDLSAALGLNSVQAYSLRNRLGVYVESIGIFMVYDGIG